MLTFDRRDGHFHVRAVAICVRNQDVLIHQAVGDTVWSLPGGRVEMGEASATTLIREMAEELRTRVHCLSLRAIIEVIDQRAQGGFFHEVGFYYQVDLPDVGWSQTPFRGPEVTNPVDFWWCPIPRIDEIVVLPPVVRQVLTGHGIQHLVYQP